MGSRFLWEINNWQYPKLPNTKAQRDNPDDDSADGADMMAMIRYLVMSWWERVGKKASTREPKQEDQHPGFTEGGRVRDWENEEDNARPYQIPQYHLPRYTAPTEWQEQDD